MPPAPHAVPRRGPGTFCAMDTVRWGILGTGYMATTLTRAIQGLRDGEVVAVASRSRDRADAFARRHGVPAALGRYEDLIDRDDLDVVFVATTNELHHPLTLACLERHTPVLCEKPLARNLHEGREMVTAARQNGTFLMEALWMRFQPFLDRLEELVAAEIGAPQLVQATFAFPVALQPGSRWYDPALAGGVLFDIGIYPLALALHLLGPPEESTATAALAGTGVDRQIGVVARHAGGALSVSTATFAADAGVEAQVAGPDGRIRIHQPFHHASLLTVHRSAEQVDRIVVGSDDAAWQHEVAEVHGCLRSGLTESPRMPLDDSLTLLAWMTESRRQVGVVYPGE